MTVTEPARTPSTALVHLPMEGIRVERRRRRRDRRLRWITGTAAATAAGSLAAVAAVNLWPGADSGASEVAEEPRAIVSVLPAGPPPPPPVLVDTTPTSTPWQRWGVQLPTGEVEGWLVTDGVRAERVIPGQIGRAIVSIPADPTQAATFNLGQRQWRVFERHQVDPNSLGALVAAQPQVPTVMLVSSLPAPLRPAVIGR